MKKSLMWNCWVFSVALWGNKRGDLFPHLLFSSSLSFSSPALVTSMLSSIGTNWICTSVVSEIKDGIKYNKKKTKLSLVLIECARTLALLTNLKQAFYTSLLLPLPSQGKAHLSGIDMQVLLPYKFIARGWVCFHRVWMACLRLGIYYRSRFTILTPTPGLLY